MTLTRRSALKFGFAGLGAALITPTLASCASGSGGSSKDLTMWVWGTALAPATLKALPGHFSGDGISVKASQIGGDFKQKLVTTFLGKSGIPDIAGIKGEDMPYFQGSANLFRDLNDFGAKDVAKDFLEWKWKAGQTQDGKQIGLPIDVGPAALWYRADVYEKAGLATDPAEVAKATATWDQFFAFGGELKSKLSLPILLNITEPFSKGYYQGTTGFVDKDGTFIGDDTHIRELWDRAVKAFKLGITGNVTDGSSDWGAGITKGTLPSLLGASWILADVQGAAASTSGKWRVTALPGGAANIGGSFLALPAGTDADGDAAFKVMSWAVNAANQAEAYTALGNFPSTPASYTSAALTAGVPFLGGQHATEVFADQAKKAPVAWLSQYDSAVSAPYYTELTNIESSGKDPETAWKDAVTAAKQALADAK